MRPSLSLLWSVVIHFLLLWEKLMRENDTLNLPFNKVQLMLLFLNAICFY